MTGRLCYDGGREGKVVNLGAHLTISTGLPQAMAACREIGADNFQFFTRNPRGGKQRAMPDAEITAGREQRATLGVRTLIGHFPYTVNLASPRPEAYEFARDTLRADLRWGDRMGADVLVVHPGSHVGDGVDAGTERITAAVNNALEGYDGQTYLLLETMAGQGSEIGQSPAELRAIMVGCGWHPALGVCLDSCHLFAAGFDLRTPAGVDAMVQAFAETVGLERLRCLHLNDSKAPVGSHKDRHELIGRGELGPAGIRAVVTHPFLRTLPICLETPVGDYREYSAEIQAVQALLQGAD